MTDRNNLLVEIANRICSRRFFFGKCAKASFVTLAGYAAFGIRQETAHAAESVLTPLALPIQAQPSLSSAQLTVEVSVVDAVSGAPITGATVDLVEGRDPLSDILSTYALGVDAWRINSKPARMTLPGPSSKVGLPYGDRKFRSVETDGTGRVQVSNIDAGSYRLISSAVGYVTKEYGSPLVGKPGIALTLSANTKSAVLRLTPAASVEGVVVARAEDRPLKDIPVYLVRPYFTASGSREFIAVKKTISDSEGRFALTGIVPGRYSVAAGSDPDIRTNKALDPQPSYKWSYYPSMSDSITAGYLPLAASQQFSGIKLALEPQQLRQVRGTLIDLQVPSSDPIRLTLSSLGPFRVQGLEFKRLRTSTPVRDGQSFEFQDLEDGTYILEASRIAPRGSNTSRTPTSAEMSFPLEVSGKNVEDWKLKFSAPLIIQGRVRTSDNGALSAALVASNSQFGEIKPQLRFSPLNALQANPIVYPDLTDGSFSLNAISGKYRVLMPGSNVYVKEVLLGGLRFQGEFVDIPIGTEKIDAVVLGTDGTSIGGAVVDQRSIPIQTAAFGLLIPDPFPSTITFYRTFQIAMEGGRFLLTTIPPGRYKLFAWRNIDDTSCFDPDVLLRSVGQATSVQVAPNNPTQINVKVIELPD